MRAPRRSGRTSSFTATQWRQPVSVSSAPALRPEALGGRGSARFPRTALRPPLSGRVPRYHGSFDILPGYKRLRERGSVRQQRSGLHQTNQGAPAQTACATADSVSTKYRSGDEKAGNGGVFFRANPEISVRIAELLYYPATPCPVVFFLLLLFLSCKRRSRMLRRVGHLWPPCPSPCPSLNGILLIISSAIDNDDSSTE